MVGRARFRAMSSPYKASSSQSRSRKNQAQGRPTNSLSMRIITRTPQSVDPSDRDRTRSPHPSFHGFSDRKQAGRIHLVRIGCRTTGNRAGRTICPGVGMSTALWHRFSGRGSIVRERLVSSHVPPSPRGKSSSRTMTGVTLRALAAIPHRVGSFCLLQTRLDLPTTSSLSCRYDATLPTFERSASVETIGRFASRSSPEVRICLPRNRLNLKG